MPRFTIPRDIYHGKGALENLKNLQGKKAVVVCGRGAMKKSGVLDKIVGYLHEAHLEVEVFEGVEHDPSIETVERGAEFMRKFEPDWIVAVGGGSPLDAAKAMWEFYEHPESTFEGLCVPFTFPKMRTRAKFVAIPSTSGTASEVTSFSIITDNKTGIKYPLADFEITPDISIVDPELAESMPKTLVASTGMDALTHAIEGYVSTAHCDFTDAVTLHSIKMIFENLKKSYEGDMDARANMHNASCLAGMSFSNALLGIVHSMSHKTGAVYKSGYIVHGCANAIYLPKVIKFNSKNEEAKSRYANIGRFIGLTGNSDDEVVEKLINRIRELNISMGISLSIKNYENGRINEEEFVSRLSEVAANAISDACTLTNPRKPTQSEMEKLLLACFYDREVDF